MSVFTEETALIGKAMQESVKRSAKEAAATIAEEFANADPNEVVDPVISILETAGHIILGV